MKTLHLVFGLALNVFFIYGQEQQTKPKVSIQTNLGTMIVELEPGMAPLTVENFLNYVKGGHYEDTIFHRVIDGFMIQGGGMTERMQEKAIGSPVRNESRADGLKNLRGTIAMARSDDANSATSQFFINLVDNAKLDFASNSPAGIGYCVFGNVVSGMEVVDKIGKVRTLWRRGYSDVPEFPVKITKVEILPDDN